VSRQEKNHVWKRKKDAGSIKAHNDWYEIIKVFAALFSKSDCFAYALK
jgi:hypothetical protein